MTSPIVNKNRSTGDLLSTFKKTTSHLDCQTSIMTKKNTVNNIPEHKNNSIQISPEAKALNAYIKINNIKSQLEASTYTINYPQLAEKIAKKAIQHGN